MTTKPNEEIWNNYLKSLEDGKKVDNKELLNLIMDLVEAAEIPKALEQVSAAEATAQLNRKTGNRFH